MIRRNGLITPGLLAKLIRPRTPGTRAGLVLAAIFLTACTTLETYPGGGSVVDLPLTAGDKIVIHFTDPQMEPRTLIFRSVEADALSGQLPWDRDTVERHRWDSISHIDYRRFSAGKTAALTLLGLLTLVAVKDIGDNFSKFFDNIFGGAD